MLAAPGHQARAPHQGPEYWTRQCTRAPGQGTRAPHQGTRAPGSKASAPGRYQVAFRTYMRPHTCDVAVMRPRSGRTRCKPALGRATGFVPTSPPPTCRHPHVCSETKGRLLVACQILPVPKLRGVGRPGGIRNLVVGQQNLRIEMWNEVLLELGLSPPGPAKRSVDKGLLRNRGIPEAARGAPSSQAHHAHQRRVGRRD